MTDINNVVIVGRSTRDIGERDYTCTRSGVYCLKISVAVNKSEKDAAGNWQDRASFVDVTIWGKMAENLRPKISKGTKMCVSGSLYQERWQGQDGKTSSRLTVVADRVDIMQGTPASTPGNAPNPAPSAPSAPSEAPSAFDQYTNDLPF
jgi:single-strand DNA-binding protein